MPKKDLEKKEKVVEEETEETKAKKASIMNKYLTDSVTPPSVGDVVDGKVIGIEKSCVFIDLPPYGTGIIYGKEYISARDSIKKLNIGDNVQAKVVDLSHKEGYIELSLKEARQAMIWGEAEEAIKNKTVFELPVEEANKGGLIINYQGIKGFLPASQLKAEHYPRVEFGDKEKIFEELKKLVGQKISVMLISALPKEGKLIFSEKNLDGKKSSVGGVKSMKSTEKYKIGDILEGDITGIVDFGAFVKIDDNMEGLVHISEMDWALVEDPRALFKVGEHVKVKVIDVKDGKVSLSVKALKENPWIHAAKKYKIGDEVKGVVIKYNKHGALASIEEGISGLVHISEFGNEAKLKESLGLGKSYTFKIILLEAASQKMGLSFIKK